MALSHRPRTRRCSPTRRCISSRWRKSRDGLSLIIQKLEELKVGVQAIDTKQDTVWNGQHLLVQEIQALGEKIALLGSTGYSRRKGSEFRFGDDNGAGG
jgi:hypothetical protein